MEENLNQSHNYIMSGYTNCKKVYTNTVHQVQNVKENENDNNKN